MVTFLAHRQHGAGHVARVLLHALRKRDNVVVENLFFARENEHGRQAGDVIEHGGGAARAVGRALEELFLHVGDDPARENVKVRARGGSERGCVALVDPRRDEREGGGGAALGKRLFRVDGDRDGERAAGGIASDDDPPRVDVHRLEKEAVGGKARVVGGGEGMLGGERVVDREDADAARVRLGKDRAQVGHFFNALERAAKDVAAAVQPEEDDAVGARGIGLAEPDAGKFLRRDRAMRKGGGGDGADDRHHAASGGKLEVGKGKAQRAGNDFLAQCPCGIHGAANDAPNERQESLHNRVDDKARQSPTETTILE